MFHLLIQPFECLLALVLVVSGLELNLEPDELVKAQRESLGSFYFFDQNGETLLLNRSLFIYGEKLYDNWSYWSQCSPHTCLEHRFRRCVDDSYTHLIDHLASNKKICPFKYIVEERPCVNTSNCLINANLSIELQRMEEICGERGSSDEESKKKSRKRYKDYHNELDAQEEDDEFGSRSQFELKIIGGKTAKSFSWPWHVGLYKVRSYNASEGLTPLKPENIICGGTLITPQWVLTAAHCLKPILGSLSAFQQGVPVPMNTPEMAPYSLLVRAGDTNLEGTRRQNERESDHLVDLVVIHPEWMVRRFNGPFDIALLRLETPVEIGNGGVGVACLPKEADAMPSEDAVCYTVGWGENERSDNMWSIDRREIYYSRIFHPFGLGRYGRRLRRSQSLKELRVTVDQLEKCFRYEPENNNQICIGNPNKGVCVGDTGGGLFCRNESDKKWYVYGVMGSGSTQRCRYRRWLVNSVGRVASWINRYVV